MTMKGKYGNEKFLHRRLVAILKVEQRFENHKTTAAFYQVRGIAVPNNCMTAETKPMSFEMTGGNFRKEYKSISDEKEIIRRWDAGYKLRARRNATFLACKSLYLNLIDPVILSDQMLINIFGRIPLTLVPPPISEDEFSALSNLAFA